MAILWGFELGVANGLKVGVVLGLGFGCGPAQVLRTGLH